MRLLSLILLLVGHMIIVTAQTRTKQVKLPKYKGDPSCIYKSKYSVEKRNQFYPFNITDTIKLVSFRHHWRNYPIKGDTILVDSLIENISLTTTQVNDLTDLLYNNFDKQHPNYGLMSQCFLPRNAILFIDKLGNVIEHIFICFHCDNFRVSSDRITLGDHCTEKMEKLRQFFITSQVAYGTDKIINSYPGEESDDYIVLPPVQQ